MTTFNNELIGSFDDKTNEHVQVWYNEAKVKAFAFHSVGLKGVLGAYHRVFGVKVDARHVWEATKAFSCVTNICAVPADGYNGGTEYYVHWVMDTVTGTEEFRAGGKYGECIARMVKTGYVQDAA